ncbi:hypothetical protein DMA11_17140 [Marinilabiliaceae bacterium JC017]|nr:hypothetical protein DMA11_17140 [Marinilabiliaceae bacterium JC017]
MQVKISSLLMIGAWLILSCQTNPTHKTREVLPFHDFKNGDIICRLGNGYFSDYFRKCSKTETLYSHVGIAKIENDSIFVIHTEANELTGIGHVKKESISTFLKEVRNWGVYRIACHDSIKRRVVNKAMEYYKSKIPFDKNFDISSDDELYCAELVACCINQAFNNSKIICPDIEFARHMYYGIDNIYLFPLCNVIYKSIKDDNRSLDNSL